MAEEAEKNEEQRRGGPRGVRLYVYVSRKTKIKRTDRSVGEEGRGGVRASEEKTRT